MLSPDGYSKTRRTILWKTLQGLSNFLNPEVVHAAEGVRVFVLENLPLREAGGGAVIGKASMVGMQDSGVDLESEEGQVVFPEKFIDAGQRHAVFLNVEQQVAAGADAEEIRRIQGRAEIRAVARLHQVLAEAPNLIGRGTVTALGDELPYPHDVAPRRRAVKAELHEAAGAQQGQQHLPSGPRVGEVVQHADRFDYIKAAPERAELEQVGLRIFH